jgi:hypothetical protein
MLSLRSGSKTFGALKLAFLGFFFYFYYIKSTFFSVHQQPSDLKTKYSLIKVSQKKPGLVLLALVSKFENDASTSLNGKN